MRVVPTATRIQRVTLACGVVAALIAAVGGWSDPAHFFPAWLFAWLCVLGIALGALANVMIHELTGGAWGFVIRRVLESAIGTMPVVALLGLPLAFGLSHLYPWAAPRGADAMLDAKAWYLEAPFFVARAVAYLAVWIALALALGRQWRARRTNAVGAAAQPAARALAIVGLILYALTMTLAAVDWIMSLSRDWHSTGFGLLVMTSQALAAFAFGVAASVAGGALHGARHPPVAVPEDAMNEPPGTARDAQDLGNILMMYAMLWAYLAFTQFLIIWAEDLPTEIGWYLARATPGWKALAVIVVLLQFALPFVAMLFRAFKRDALRLAALCAVVLCAHVLEIAWQVLPAFDGAQRWFAPLALVAVGGLWGAAFMALHARSLRVSATFDIPVAVEHG